MNAGVHSFNHSFDKYLFEYLFAYLLPARHCARCPGMPVSKIGYISALGEPAFSWNMGITYLPG